MEIDDLMKVVRKIPGPDGWWHLSGQTVYLLLAHELVDYGLSTEKALDILERAYAAAADEFGI